MLHATTKFKRILLFLGSVKMTVVLLVVGTLVMALGTVLESRISTDLARSVVYGHLWFDLFLFMIVVNLAAAVINRIPLKRHQMSFVVVHAAIILLMVGAWISRTFGFEGQLPVAEGQSSAELLLYEKELVLSSSTEGRHNPGQAAILRRFPIPDTVFLAGHSFQQESPGNPGITVLEFVSNGFQENGIQHDPDASGPGIEFQVAGHGESLDGWLLADHAEYRSNNLGPFVVEMLRFNGEAEFQHRLQSLSLNPSLIIKGIDADLAKRIELPQDIDRDIDLGGGVTARVIGYLEHTRVAEDGLSNDPTAPWNPAVTVEIWRGEQYEKHTVFSEFPDFALHEISEQGPLTQEILFDAPNASGSPVLSLLVGPSGQAYSQVTDSKGRQMALAATDGSHIEIGSTGFHFTLKRILGRARFATTVRSAQPGEEGGRALIRLEVAMDARRDEFWLPASSSRIVPLFGEGVQISMRRKTKALPFRIDVEDFTVEFYPGSRRASNYSSRVSLAAIDGSAIPTSAVISMNRPLDYLGFRLFQSSYVLGQGGAPDTTILTVSYDPGVPIVYVSFVLLIFGVAWFSLGDGRKKRSMTSTPKVDADITLILEPRAMGKDEYSVSKTKLPPSDSAVESAETSTITGKSR